ncbi:MAG: PAS domain S-box protein, partial [Janthinobacterium lividum]
MIKTLDRGRSLRAQLTLLCLGLLVPTLVFVGVLFWRISTSETGRAEEQARSQSRALANALDREVIGVLTTLQALATSPSLQTGDLPEFYRQIGEMRRLQHIHISLRDVTGRALMTTRVPLGGDVAVPPPLAAADQEVLRSGKPMVTDMFSGTTSAASVFQIIAAPVLVQGRPTYLIGASLDPDYLEGVFRRESLGPGWTGSLVDRNFLVVARTADQATYVGQLSSEDLRRHAAAAGSGMYYGRTITGTYSLVGFTHSALTGWTVSVNVPTEVVTAPMRRSLLLLLVLGAVLIAFAGLLAVTAGRRIIRAIQRLRAAADAIGQGLPVTNVQTPIAEINVVGQALYFAAAQLHARAEERDAAEISVRNSEAHLSGIFAQTGAGLVEAELDGRIISANDHYCALVGRTADELCRMRLRDIPHPD